MEKENFNNSKEVEVGGDATKYGEFISSYFAWVSLPEQKKKVEKLENVTKSNKDKVENKTKNKENKENRRKNKEIKET